MNEMQDNFAINAEDWRRLLDKVDRICEALYEVKAQLSLQCERTEQTMGRIESTLENHSNRIDGLEEWRHRREIDIARMAQEQTDRDRSLKFFAAAMSATWVVFVAVHDHITDWLRHFFTGR